MQQQYKKIFKLFLMIMMVFQIWVVMKVVEIMFGMLLMIIIPVGKIVMMKMMETVVKTPQIYGSLLMSQMMLMVNAKVQMEQIVTIRHMYGLQYGQLILGLILKI